MANCELTTIRQISLDCTFGAINFQSFPVLTNWFWAIDKALVFNAGIMRMANKVQSHLFRKSKRYAAIHVRSEKDWVKHCKIYRKPNCMANTDRLFNVLKIEGVSQNQPLYIASGFSIQQMQNRSEFRSLTAGFDVITKEQILGTDPAFKALSPKKDTAVLAAIDYAVCNASSTFVGNSVSTFSAMQMLSAKHQTASSDPKQEKITFHYNGGNIPLEEVIPITRRQRDKTSRPLKWLFVMTEGSSKEYVQMMQVAVQSAIQNSGCLPVCLYMRLAGLHIEDPQKEGAKFWWSARPPPPETHATA